MEEPSEGVFGNLPASRPGARSPRRESGEEKPEPKPAPKKAAAKPPPAPAPPPPPSRTSQSSRSAGTERRSAQDEGDVGIGGVEDLAWAGVTVAAKAATAGVKLMSRALESARKQVERPPKP